MGPWPGRSGLRTPGSLGLPTTPCGRLHLTSIPCILIHFSWEVRMHTPNWSNTCTIATAHAPDLTAWPCFSCCILDAQVALLGGQHMTSLPHELLGWTHHPLIINKHKHIACYLSIFPSLGYPLSYSLVPGRLSSTRSHWKVFSSLPSHPTPISETTEIDTMQ